MNRTRSSTKSSIASSGFQTVWVVDFEYSTNPDGLPVPVCLAAREVVSGRRLQLWHDEMGARPPYDVGPGSLFVCYSGGGAELACHTVLHWPLPINVIDLMTEFRWHVCGKVDVHGLRIDKGLSMLKAAEVMQVATPLDDTEKLAMRDLIMSGGPFDAAQRESILAYCAEDVEAETGVLLALDAKGLDLPRAQWRGEFTKATARMWFRGVPIDPKYQVLATDPALRQRFREALIREIEVDYPIYENSVLKSELLGQWFTANGIPIPLTAKSRRVSTSAERLAQIAQDHAEVAPLVDALRTLSQLKEYHLPVGADGRLRAWFATFLTITGRAAPPTDEYIYNVPAWHRATIAPPEGMALAYIDWSAMEFGLAAAMSRDPAMMAYYESGDPYIAAAVAGGAIPSGSNDRTHPAARKLFKTGLLACQYGIGVKTLAARLQTSEAYARYFLALHHRLFPRYWEWSDGVVRKAIQKGEIVSRHGWRYEVHPPHSVRRLRNWPIQTLGAEILRAACIYADAAGVEMLATAHDAILIQAPIEVIDAQVALMSACMARASSVLTGGFVLRADTDPRNVKRGSERFIEARGASTLRVVDRFLDREARRG